MLTKIHLSHQKKRLKKLNSPQLWTKNTKSRIKNVLFRFAAPLCICAVNKKSKTQNIKH